MPVVTSGVITAEPVKVCIRQYPGILYIKKNQLYIFPVVGLCSFARYGKWGRLLIRFRLRYESIR